MLAPAILTVGLELYFFLSTLPSGYFHWKGDGIINFAFGHFDRDLECFAFLGLQGKGGGRDGYDFSIVGKGYGKGEGVGTFRAVVEDLIVFNANGFSWA